jgi:hypothetical protein
MYWAFYISSSFVLTCIDFQYIVFFFHHTKCFCRTDGKFGEVCVCDLYHMNLKD